MSQEDRVKWDARYASPAAAPPLPSAWLVAAADWLPAAGRALDLAGGLGRHALWLAERGLATTLLDISQLALDQAAERARERRLPLATKCLDLDVEAPPGPWDVIVSCNFLWTPLFDRLADWLSPGGVLFYSQPTRKSLERHPKPPAPFLLPEGVLPGLISGLETLFHEEGWLDDGRHEVRLIVRRPERFSA